ncbi:exopolyphosphatase [Halalkalibacter nanhaiisediminis]|uniref:Exopolyphosphatase n=1 Tax=Halalkalibacter nanhaiisediminis TaxID=688079 RepID=A0A562QLZ8_9BACI|nr:exopolyphosphatase [Halalkalibacter nanhaiisediminis]TWI57777.1 exopolyphosphatase/guanosine-5'-triphosphate,3'-diphosphate pyrophosphatase [Halalkalibacter nanhaiisediminis]
MIEKQFAIIDIGSNSVRLVINQIDHNGCYKELHNYKTVARLSSHINADGHFTKKGINILLDTLTRFKDIIHFHHVKEVTAIATAAMRKANNRNQVVELVKERLAFDIQILSEYEEAFYGYLAVVNSTNIKNGYTIDIGGGSTEVTFFENRELIYYHSFPFGAVTLQQQFVKGEQPTERELAAIKVFISSQLKTLSWLQENRDYPVIGIGGSARNLSLIHQRQIEYPLAGLHQYEFSRTELHNLNKMLQQTTYEERLSIDGLSKDRADIIVPAAEVISSLVDHVNADTFIMSRKGLRDGIFYEELLRSMETRYFPNVAEESFYQLSHSYEVNLDHVNHITYLATRLYQELSANCSTKHDQKVALQLLKHSARVLYIGEYINSEASSQNTFYLVTNMTIEGLSHQERLAIAFISSFKSKSQLMQFAKPFKNLLHKKQLKLYEFLGSIMKLAYCLDRTKRNAVVEIGHIDVNDKTFIIPLYYQEDAHFEDMQAGKHKKHLERATGYDIELHYIPSIDLKKPILT